MPQRRVIRNQSLGSTLLILPALGLFSLWLWAPGCAGQASCNDFYGLLSLPVALLSISAGVLYLAALMEALSRCIHMKTWLWLLAIVPFGPLGIFVYGLAGPKDSTPELHDWFDPRARRKRRNRLGRS